MDTRGLLQRLLQSLFTRTIVLRDNGSQTHAPPLAPPPSYYTLLDSLGSADRCSVKHALIHKTHSVLIWWGYKDLLQCEVNTSKLGFCG